MPKRAHESGEDQCDDQRVKARVAMKKYRDRVREDIEAGRLSQEEIQRRREYETKRKRAQRAKKAAEKASTTAERQTVASKSTCHVLVEPLAQVPSSVAAQRQYSRSQDAEVQAGEPHVTCNAGVQIAPLWLHAEVQTEPEYGFFPLPNIPATRQKDFVSGVRGIEVPECAE
ncbi:hypothetical protein PAXRUDRAFT_29217, partial [Paxillus rubicundulus Ve08.2h10]